MKSAEELVLKSFSQDAKQSFKKYRFDQIGKITIGVLTAIAILFLIHITNH
ncbi:hypothetical protein [Dokdonia sp. Hel_I_53]|uniref:hypothetical protein n=1 Tax=Dokdonia sp. Hel_I_53 TaxID=1566287 RepID=UPI001198E7D2|nr:hypothetical protein [Dokdonia sp. Hel_I_53]TVZ52537.1 hypothetical protein OD90_1714 [Dokdonia sp. Hel_I_53]